MNEHEFLLKLQQRAREQEREIQAVPFPKIFSFVVAWLSHHPWRFLIPLAFLVTFILRSIFGSEYTDFILSLFR